MVNPIIPKVTHRPSGDSGKTIRSLSAGVRPKAANEILAGRVLAEPRENRETAQTQAPLAAPESSKETDFIRDELAKMNERVQKAEKDLVEGRQEFNRQSVEAEAQIVSLSEDLAAVIAVISAPQPRFLLWGVCLFAAISAIAAGAYFFLPRPGLPVASAALEAGNGNQPAWQSAARLGRNAAAPQSIMPFPGGASPEEQALDRLNLALGRIPQPNIDDVLSVANSALLADGSPPCTVRSPAGGRSLLVVVKYPGDARPLAAALLRCADAVERAIK
jgi:hypothetical protein